jgi:hypothetical protein
MRRRGPSGPWDEALSIWGSSGLRVGHALDRLLHVWWGTRSTAAAPSALSAAIRPLPRKVCVAGVASGTLSGEGRSCRACNRDVGGAGSSCNPCNRHPDRRGEVLQPLQPGPWRRGKLLQPLHRYLGGASSESRGRRRRIGTSRSLLPGDPSWAVRPGDGRRGELGKEKIVSRRHHGQGTGLSAREAENKRRGSGSRSEPFGPAPIWWTGFSSELPYDVRTPPG